MISGSITFSNLTLQYNDSAHTHAVTNAGSNTYSYDANGSQTTRVIGGQTYTLAYDAENRLVSVSGAVTASFVYDGDGKQVKSVINGVTTYLVGAHYHLENGQVTKYYFAGAQRVAVRKNGTLSYMLTDHLGSTLGITNTSGTLTAGTLYKAWGETRYTLGTVPTKFKYTGQREESAFGLYFYNARWYDPAVGRFTSADTIVPPGFQGLDRYAYVRNSPLIYTDPSGHIPWQLIFVFLFISSIPGDAGPYPSNSGSELIGNMAIRTFDPIDAFYTGIECLSGECDALDVVLSVVPFANGGMKNLADLAKAIERAQTTGKWINRVESMSDDARAYQRFISGRSDDAVFQLNGYTFDGFDASRGILQDAKNIPENFVDPKTGGFASWVTDGPDEWLKQAYNQISAADGLKNEWYFSSQAVRDAMYKLFLKEDPEILKHINLIYKPMK